MAGMDDNVSEIGGWVSPPAPSSRTLLSDTLNYELASKSLTDILVEEPEKQKLDVGSNEEEQETGFQFSSGVEPNSQVGFAERMAARAGFSTLKIDTVHNKSEELNTSTSGVWSPYLTIPPGLSPTSLLDSPAFLSNMDQSSPTTGKFLFEPCHSANIVSTSAIPYGVKDQSLEVVSESFSFRPRLADNKVSLPSDHSDQERSEKGTASPFWNQYLQVGLSSSLDQEDVAKDAAATLKVSDSFISSEQSPPLDGQQDEEADIKGKFSSVAVNQPDEDGYSWRKYGQKQVKGSEHPRSYYKCTYQSCQVKKKVERSLEGHITEIIYKGKHNHPKPPANLLSDGSEHPAQHTGIDGKPIWTSSQNSNEGRDWKNDGIEASSTSAPGPSANELQFEPSDAAVAVSFTLSNDEEDNGGTHGCVSLGGDGEGDETESKRRKLDASAMDMSAASRAAREPRVVVQTTSEVDILDDGYRWRKYGQKIVKGNPNPRSYYKCTNPGCTVRKHVERASHDLKSVITTYEGKHNHDVPAARGSGHSNAGPFTAASATMALPQNLNRRPEPTQMQDNLMTFNVPAQLGQPPVSFAFRMAQQGLNHHLGVAGLSMVRPMNTPAPTLYAHMIHQEQTESGFMAPKG